MLQQYQHPCLQFLLILIPSLFFHLPSLQAQEDYNQSFRLQYHFSPPQNWINDPCGMVYFNGEYHLMYQYNPYGNQWGNMSWGHAVSRDMVHWDNLPVALEGKNDPLGAIFSGGTVVDLNNTAGFNTSDSHAMIAVFTHAASSQQQSIAYSTNEGRSWTKYAGNPVVPNPGINDFRDPQVIWYAPQSKWIMTLAVGNKIRLYSSPNLKDWAFKSDFGEDIGAHGGVWECPDFFPLKVEDSEEEKWVMLVSLGSGASAGGSGTQYFVGDFDGTTFSLTEEFEAALEEEEYLPEGEIFENFEGSDYGNWTKTGTAFGNRPANGTLSGQQMVEGFLGNGLVNTFIAGDAPQGTLTSPIFTLQKPYINFLIGGGNHPDKTAIQLLIDGETVLSSTGKNAEKLLWEAWEVSEWLGKTAQIKIMDFHSEGWGHINIDHILFSNEAAKSPPIKAFWADYRPDNYAGRSWENMPESSEYQRIWLGWMSNWAYANNLPTSPWKGSMTLPKSLQLKQLPQGLRLLQQPIKELQNLRGQHFSFRTNKSIEAANEFIVSNNIEGLTYEVKLRLQPNNSEKVGVKVRSSIFYETLIGFDSANNQVFVNRSNASQFNFDGNFGDVFTAPLGAEKQEIKLHIFVDRSSVEVFVNQGEQVLTARIFPSVGATGISFFQEGGNGNDAVISSFDFWELTSIWGNPTHIEAAEHEQILLYPNPTQSEFWLQMPPSISSTLQLSLWNREGKEIPLEYDSNNVSTRTAHVRFDADLEEGLYFLKIGVDEKEFCKKVVIGE